SRRWVELADWPPPTVPQAWYLHPEGRLSPHPPDDSSPDRYRYDPADPTPGIGGPSLLIGNAGPKEQRRRETRSDVLTYTSDALAQDLTVIGPVRTDLHLRSSLDHTDFFVRLCDVSPQGKSKNLSDGIVRLAPGDVTRGPDGSFFLRIDLWPTANTFRRGHCVRLQISSGAHPLFVRNTGSGERLADATRLCPADQEVLHDPAHQSALLLAVGGF
ncbi:MAG: CocE/NonD family hydrolase, partial [Acidimicrobiales bacterium]